MLNLPRDEHEPLLHAPSGSGQTSPRALQTRLRTTSTVVTTSPLTADPIPPEPASAPAWSEVAPTAGPPAAASASAATEGATHAHTPEPTEYWPRKWLSAPPAPVEPTIVPYPETPPGGPAQGWVILELFISASGQVEKIEVLSSDAPDEFIESARQTFFQSSFNPGLKDKVAVPSRVKIEVRFEQR